GWQLFDQLIHDPATAGIPVHVVSVREEDQLRGNQEGLTFLTKPVTKDILAELFDRIKAGRRNVRSLLVVEDDPVQRRQIADQFTRPGVEVFAVATGADALNALRKKTFDCIVLDLGLPDMTGMEFIDQAQSDDLTRSIPIIVYTAMDLSRRAQAKLKKTTQSVVAKDPASGAELAEQVEHWLRGLEPVAEASPAGNGSGNGRKSAATTAVAAPPKRAARGTSRGTPGGSLSGQRLLVVDDDVRNIYALTALLEREGAEVLNAETGQEALEILASESAIGAVLMDVMMPEMDGLETTRRIRAEPRHQGLPIIALTAKAMQGDREKCLEAGASDYIAKPVDTGQLLDLLRRWTAGAAERA
ncbi:MAG: response regulator, partial [Chloroflexota bacterium]